MKTLIRVVTSAAIVIAMCGSAHAVVPVPGPSPVPDPWTSVYTAPVGPSVFLFSNMSCNVLNSGPVAAKIIVEVHAEDGSIIAKQGPVMLPPGQGTSIPGGTFGTYCKFSIQGGANNLNAVAVFHAHNDDKYAAALPAQ